MGSKDVDADARAALLLTAGLTFARPDRAVSARCWSSTPTRPSTGYGRGIPAFGYYSKPPIIAWAIWASTAFGGDAEPWVRLPAVLFQGAATLLVFQIARRLYGSRTALAATALYALTPAIQLSATVVATDSPLLAFIGLAILAYVGLQGAEGRRRLLLAAGLGAALGLAFLSKYAAVYVLIGVGLHLGPRLAARRSWSPAAAALAAGSFLLVMGPNLAWNAAHGFCHGSAHRGGCALDGRPTVQSSRAGRIPGQPVRGLRARPLRGADRRFGDAGLATAAGAGGPAPPLLHPAADRHRGGAGLRQPGQRQLVGGELSAGRDPGGGLADALAGAAVADRGAGDPGGGRRGVPGDGAEAQPCRRAFLGQANSLKRARGWDQTAKIVIRKVREAQPAGLSAIAVNNRFLYYALAYYGRAYFHEPLAAPLKIWVRGSGAGNQAEASAPLTPADGQRVLAVAYEHWFNSEMAADFGRVTDPEIDDVWLDRKHQRVVDMFVGERFQPRPRDPKTGYPAPEWRPGDTVSPSPAPP